MKRRAFIFGAGREDRWEYPEEAIRELIANAVIHRDHHPLARGTPVGVRRYPDRIAVSSPGGLHGAVLPGLLVDRICAARVDTGVGV